MAHFSSMAYPRRRRRHHLPKLQSTTPNAVPIPPHLNILMVQSVREKEGGGKDTKKTNPSIFPFPSPVPSAIVCPSCHSSTPTTTAHDTKPTTTTTYATPQPSPTPIRVIPYQHGLSNVSPSVSKKTHPSSTNSKHTFDPPWWKPSEQRNKMSSPPRHPPMKRLVSGKLVYGVDTAAVQRVDSQRNSNKMPTRFPPPLTLFANAWRTFWIHMWIPAP
mmetsp:Transcript_26761/g.31582  ORF Transcript_26761/g.31582 Transcript_26761/m.31582 type:complete len:217 (+) Transcript_26761:180-830(+)